MNEVVNKLGLTDVTILNERAEDKANEYREHFDIVTARAVARMNVLLELTFSYVKQDGVFIAYKGQNFEEEMIEADYAIKLLGENGRYIYI